MTASPESAQHSEQSRIPRLHLWWTMVLVLTALGGAGLAVAVDRPGNPVQRPELTYRADLAAQPWIDQLAQELDAAQADAASLSTAGLDVLNGLQTFDLQGANAALDSGDRTAAGIETRLLELHRILDEAHAATDRWRLGPVTASLFDQIGDAISTADLIPTEWSALAAVGRTVAGLVTALGGHDQTVFHATTAGRSGRWADALVLLRGAAADSLNVAQAARDRLALTVTVDTLDDLMGRQRAYDDALIALYQHLADGGAQSGRRYRALQNTVVAAQAALPSDGTVLVVIVGETAGLPIADQLLAMEEAHGAINDALQAVSDVRTGGPDATPAATAAP